MPCLACLLAKDSAPHRYTPQTVPHSLTIVRLKPSKDASISLKAQVTTNLGATDGWSADEVTIKGALQGVDQSDLPDDEPYATSDYERIKVQANTAKNAVVEGKQFLRIIVEKQ